MKNRFVVLAVGIIILLSGCASLAGVFGVASESYVEEQLQSVRDEFQSQISDTQGGVSANRSALSAYADTARQLEELIESIRNTVETTDELKRLADVLEQRFENLPVETIRQLVTILAEYLEGK
jgi:septal ring factor EnvC (AmiA/AmiB activator)